MLNILVWLGVVELIGLLAFPFAFLLLSRLPDRGYSLTKPIGLLLTFYPVWMLGSSHIVPVGIVTIVLVLVILATLSFLIYRVAQNQIAAYISENWKTLVLTEIVFLFIFFLWVYVKLYDSSINHTEQPMDLAFLNATSRSLYFPPADPWFAGHSISYYYFGYLIMGGLTTLTGISSSVSYNLALILTVAMCAVGAFGVGMNMVRLNGGSQAISFLIGLVSVALLVFVANMESLLEFIRATGSGSTNLWEWINIKGLDGPLESKSWYPSEPGWWWWRATRVIDTIQDGVSLDYTITEFPFFSFLLGDLHPHVMNLPFLILFTSFALNLVVSPDHIGIEWLKRNIWQVLFLGMLLGAIGFVNLWDMPTMAGLFMGAVFLKAYWQKRTISMAIISTIPVVFLVVVLAFALYFPFYLTFSSSASGISPVDLTGDGAQYVTRYFHLAVIWGLFLLIALPFLVVEFISVIQSQRLNIRNIIVSICVSSFPFILWVFIEGTLGGNPLETLDLVSERFFQVLPLITLAAMALYLAIASRSREGFHRISAFPFLLIFVGVLLVLGPELFYVVDLFNNRMNTMFKFYYQAWLFFAIASPFAIYHLGTGIYKSRSILRVTGYGWITIMTIVATGVLYYPIASVYSKTSGFQGEATLNGLSYLKLENPNEALAIEWFKENTGVKDRILEAVGSDYDAKSSLISTTTGIPTLLGWPGHERQWRGGGTEIKNREDLVNRLYKSKEIELIKEALSKYDVTYVYVGSRERAKYGAPPLEKLSEILKPVFISGDVSIYQYRG